MHGTPFLEKGSFLLSLFGETELHVAQASPEFTTQLKLALTSWVLGLQVCVTTFGFMQCWGLNPERHGC